MSPLRPSTTVLAVALFVAACRPRPPREPEAVDAGRTAVPDVAPVVDAGGSDGGADAGATGLRIAALGEGSQAERAATVDRTNRVRVEGAVRDDGSPLQSAATGLALRPGDLLRCGEGSRVTLDPGGAGEVELRGPAVFEAASWAGADGALSQGVARVSSAGATPVRVDTPAGRLIVSAGEAWVAVADDGSVVVRARRGAVTVWPSPPPPAVRATRLSAAEVARRRADAGGHPVLLDVDIVELAPGVRPVSPVSLDEGAARAWDPSGAAHRHAPARAAEEPAGVTRWAQAEGRAMGALGHLIAVGRMSRAGAGDVSDARGVLAALRGRATSLQGSERDRLAAALSLALGRATARARRGRDLATRGGDVTSLVQLAPIDALRIEARSVAPLDAPR